MRITRQLKIRLYPQVKRIAPAPRHMVGVGEKDNANAQEWLIVKAGRARTPREARMMLTCYGVQRAAELLPLLPPPRRRSSLKERFNRAMMRIESADYINPYKGIRDNRNNTIPLDYRYRGNKNRGE